MATYRKRGKRWQAIIRLADHPPESGTFATRAEAKAWAEDREEVLRSGRAGAAGGRTLADAMREYVDKVSPTHRGARWERVRVTALLRDKALVGASLDTLSASTFADWRDRRMAQVSVGSVLRDWTLVRSIIEYARRDLGWVRFNPMRDVRKPAAPPHRDRRISDDEIERMRLALGWPADDTPVVSYAQQIAVMFLLALETAMRAGELQSLTWATVDLESRTARLPLTKNGTARSVPLSTRAVALLSVMRGVSADSVFTVPAATRDTLFRRARDAAQIDNLKFHDTRHEAITRLARKLDVLDLARMVGHRDLGSLRIYYNASASEIAERLG